MRDEFQTSAGSTPAAQTAPRSGGGASKGIMARLIRGKRDTDRTSHDVPHRPVTDTPEPAQLLTPELQRLQKRRISPRPAGFDTPGNPGPASVGPSLQRAKNTRRSPTRNRALSFGFAVVLPLLTVAFYFGVMARAQYTSTVAFTIRSIDSGGVTDALSGFAQIAGGARSTDALILAAFLESQTLLERLNGRLDLVRHYSAPFDIDPVFALSPSARIEARLTHWRRMLGVQVDPATGLVELRVTAFSPEMAQLIARELLVESRALLNELNAEAQASVTVQAQAEFAVARQNLTDARAALTAFRTESRIFDPNSDFEGRVGVLRHLQGQLAQALVEQDLRRPDGTSNGAETRVQVLRTRIDAERGRLGMTSDGSRADYPELLATHERLAADRDYADAAYRAARTTLDLALAQAARRDLYLAVFVQPTLPERADHARTLGTIGLTALFLSLAWAIGLFARAAVLDRR